MLNREILLAKSSVPKTAELTVSYQEDTYHPSGWDVSLFYLDTPDELISLAYGQPLTVDTFREIGFNLSSGSIGTADRIDGSVVVDRELSHGVTVRTVTNDLRTSKDYFQVITGTAKVVFYFS